MAVAVPEGPPDGNAGGICHCPDIRSATSGPRDRGPHLNLRSPPRGVGARVHACRCSCGTRGRAHDHDGEQAGCHWAPRLAPCARSASQRPPPHNPKARVAQSPVTDDRTPPTVEASDRQQNIVAGEYGAKFSSRTHHRRSEHVCQRSVKPSASPTQVRTWTCRASRNSPSSAQTRWGLLPCCIRLSPEGTGRLRPTGANTRRGFPGPRSNYHRGGRPRSVCGDRVPPVDALGLARISTSTALPAAQIGSAPAFSHVDR